MIERTKNFFQESWQELARVNWPSHQETIQLTLAVIIISLGVAVFLGILDTVFTYLLKIILKIQ